MDWVRISKGRLQRKAEGFYIIKPEHGNGPIPLFCPVCNAAIKNLEDSQRYRKWQACYECSTLYAEPNREKWLAGWRPELLDGKE